MTRQIGLVRWFADFSLLPDLLALRRDGTRPLESWAELLADRGASLDHVDEEESIEQGTMWTLMAKDAWDLCERLGLLEFGPPDSRDAIAARLGEGLPGRIQDAGRDHGWAPIVDMLQAAADKAADDGGKWAGACPGLLLCEFMRIVGLAHHNGGEEAGRFVNALPQARDGAARSEGRAAPDARMTPLTNRVAYADAVARRLNSAAGGADPDLPAMSVTEARATAMLLTHAGLMHEVYPEGPVNCLAATPPPERRPLLSAPVRIHGGGITWDPGGAGAGKVAKLLKHLVEHDHEGMVQHVFPSVGIDKRSRAATGTLPDDVGTRRLRLINKALAMELLCSMALARLDAAVRVDANCQTRNGLPFRFAPAGMTDMKASYGESPPQLALIAEVSAKRNVSAEDFLGQARQAAKHGRALLDGRRPPVYALVVTGARIGERPDLWDAFREVVAEQEGEDVRLVAVNAGDLADAMGRLIDQDAPDGLQFGAGTFAEVLDGLAEGLLSQSVGDDRPPSWMADLWVERAGGGPTLVPPPGTERPSQQSRPSGPQP